MNFFHKLVLLTVMAPITIHSQYPKLAIKIPTRSRPTQFFKVLDLYYKNLSGKMPYHFIISCDTDDFTMNNATCINKLASYPNLSFCFKPRVSKIDAYNRDLDLYNFDILLVTSDDAIPVQNSYDLIIAQTMLTHFPTLDGVLHFNDGYVNSQCNTLPIIGRAYYDRFGYIYHPEYRALVCDVEFTSVSRLLGKEYISDAILIRHEHPNNGGTAKHDNLYKENELSHKKDLALFYTRIKHSFDVTESEKNRSCSKKWSILLCTQKKPLEQVIQQQITNLNLQDTVELLTDFSDKRPEDKKNILLGMSTGTYVSIIDENVKSISPEYIKTIYDNLPSNSDVLAIVPNQCICPFNPVKRAIACLMPFCKTQEPNKLWKTMIERANVINSIIDLSNKQLITLEIKK